MIIINEQCKLSLLVIDKLFLRLYTSIYHCCQKYLDVKQNICNKQSIKNIYNAACITVSNVTSNNMMRLNKLKKAVKHWI